MIASALLSVRRGMSLRKRLSLVAAAAVAVAVLSAAVGCYLVVRSQLLGQVDGALRAQYSAVIESQHLYALDQRVAPLPASEGGSAQYIQFWAATVGVVHHAGDPLPVNSVVKTIGTRGSGSYMTDLHVNGVHLRELVFGVRLQPVGPFAGPPTPVAIQLGRPLNGVDHILSRLRLILLLLAAGGIALAAALGRLAARRVLRPLAEVTEAAENISETDDISRRLVVHADDEVGVLATRFNAMLDRLASSRDALDESVRAQRQLVADASHELRTPVTSLRTNIEVLLADPELATGERRRLLEDVVEQSEELTALVSDLIELARGDLPVEATDEVQLDRVVEESLARARRHSPGIRFEAQLVPVSLPGNAERLARAVNNLLDNAARHSPPDGVVEVTVDGHGVRVRDHGPGVAEQDLPHLFDRFFRGIGARGTQGSGLGLSIVRQVTQQHGGTVSAANASGGGAQFSLSLPVTQTVDDGVDGARADPLGVR